MYICHRSFSVGLAGIRLTLIADVSNRFIIAGPV